MEAAAFYRFSSNWKLNASATLQHAALEDGGSAPNAGNWAAKLAVDGPVWQDQLFAAFELYATGPSSQRWDGVPVHNGTTVISNLVFTTHNLFPDVGVQFRINNLFDRNNTVPGSDDTPVANMPLYGRNASLAVRYDF